MSKNREPVQYHWIMTVQTPGGQIATNDGPIGVIPGMHTHTSSYQTVLDVMRKWLDEDRLIVLYFSLDKDAM